MVQILFVSLISRDDKPLYIQSFDADADEINDKVKTQNANKFLKYNFLSHMALDVFLSPVSLSLREQQQSDGVLLLFIQDDVTVYGLETNSGLKIVVGTGEEEPAMTRIKQLFSSIHKCYLKTICNPFSDFSTGASNDGMLQTPRFDKDLLGIVSGWNSQ